MGSPQDNLDDEDVEDIEDIRSRHKKRRALNKQKNKWRYEVEHDVPARGEPPKKRPRPRIKWDPEWDEADWEDYQEFFEDF